MIKGINIDERINFTPTSDVSEPKTVFVLRPLTSAELIGYGQLVNNGKLETVGDDTICLLETCIVEIKNYDGFTDKRDIIKSLPVDVMIELVSKCNEINHMWGNDRKNS